MKLIKEIIEAATESPFAALAAGWLILVYFIVLINTYIAYM